MTCELMGGAGLTAFQARRASIASGRVIGRYASSTYRILRRASLMTCSTVGSSMPVSGVGGCVGGRPAYHRQSGWRSAGIPPARRQYLERLRADVFGPTPEPSARYEVA